MNDLARSFWGANTDCGHRHTQKHHVDLSLAFHGVEDGRGSSVIKYIAAVIRPSAVEFEI